MKIISIAAAPGGILYAVCDDGSLWCRAWNAETKEYEWYRIDGPSQS